MLRYCNLIGKSIYRRIFSINDFENIIVIGSIILLISISLLTSIISNAIDNGYIIKIILLFISINFNQPMVLERFMNKSKSLYGTNNALLLKLSVINIINENILVTFSITFLFF